ncbi:MAG: histidine phosphatase family protein [Clostridia bacterium]|nr:histidine phosphatase family protein [Clostridia bacterium]
MTTVYFIRHAQSAVTVRDGRSRPLTAKGMRDSLLVTAYLEDKNIHAVLSSPYKRAVDTVADFARKKALPIAMVEDFRERMSDAEGLGYMEFAHHMQRQWTDFSYALPDGESLASVQDRNIAAFRGVLAGHPNQNIVIGTHGIALSTIIHYYDHAYGYEDFMAMVDLTPWIVRMDFDGEHCAGMQKIDLLHPVPETDWNACQVTTAALGALKAYRFTVVFARYQDKWLYCRAKGSHNYETAGGHIEPGETPEDGARRELYEETGAALYDIAPAFDYRVRLPAEYSNGRVFIANIHELGPLPDFEMEEVKLFDTIPDHMRFPAVLPVLFDTLRKMVENVSY